MEDETIRDGAQEQEVRYLLPGCSDTRGLEVPEQQLAL